MTASVLPVERARCALQATTDAVTAHFVATVSGEGDGGADLVRSTLLSEGVGTSGIQVLSSEQSGSIRLVETVLDTPGSLTVLAAECQSVRAGQILDCSAEQVGRGLGD